MIPVAISTRAGTRARVSLWVLTSGLGDRMMICTHLYIKPPHPPLIFLPSYLYN